MLTVQITGMANGGAGIARVDGKVIFVTGAIEGDTAEVRVNSAKKSFAKADLVRLVTPSPYRRPSPCAASENCGGCPFIEAELSQQRRWKLDFALSSLAKLTGIGQQRLAALAGEVRVGGSPADNGLGYRHRVTLKAGLQKGADDTALALGFLARRSHRIAPIATCPVATPAIQAVIAELAEALMPTQPDAKAAAKTETNAQAAAGSGRKNSPRQPRGRKATGFYDLQLQEVITEGEDLRVIATFMLGRREQTLAALVKAAPELRPLAAALKASAKVAWVGTSFDSRSAPAFVFDRRGDSDGFDYLTYPGLFQQAHLGTNRQMRAFVAEALAGCPTVLDLFCGSGNLSLGLAASHITGIEGVPQSIAAAHRAVSQKAGASQKTTEGRYSYKKAAAAAYLRETRAKAEARPMSAGPLFAGIVSDPPRAGHGDMIADVIALKAPRLVLVGCDPMTHARDVAACLKGGYELKALRVFDAFPHTSHVETITVLSLTGG